jgi:hypothetical protein
MLFKPEHVEPILSGRMTQIRKLWDKPMAKVGSIHKAKTALFSKDYFASIIITGLRREKLGAITIEDAMREGYDDLVSYREGWKKINGSWEPNSVVYVVSFELKERYDLSTDKTTIAASHSLQTWERENVRPSYAH